MKTKINPHLTKSTALHKQLNDQHKHIILIIDRPHKDALHYNHASTIGGVAERSNAPVLKTGECQSSVGSNPTPSAIIHFLASSIKPILCEGLTHQSKTQLSFSPTHLNDIKAFYSLSLRQSKHFPLDDPKSPKTIYSFECMGFLKESFTI